MVRNFIMTKAGTIAWVVNCIVTIACLIVFFLTEGKEVVLAYYIPLDVALNASKAAFFFWQYYEDKRNKDDGKKVGAALNGDTEASDLKENLLSSQPTRTDDGFHHDDD